MLKAKEVNTLQRLILYIVLDTSAVVRSSINEGMKTLRALETRLSDCRIRMIVKVAGSSGQWFWCQLWFQLWRGMLCQWIDVSDVEKYPPLKIGIVLSERIQFVDTILCRSWCLIGC